MKEIFQIEREEIDEAETHEKLKEVTGQSDPLNLIFSYFDSRFQEIQNQIRKSKDKKSAEKKRKSQVKTSKQKGYRLQHESNLDRIQNPVSTSLKAVIS